MLYNSWVNCSNYVWKEVKTIINNKGGKIKTHKINITLMKSVYNLENLDSGKKRLKIKVCKIKRQEIPNLILPKK